MTNSMELLLKHGYVVLFVVVLAEQIGLPIPSAPFLLAAGALAGMHKLNLLEALVLAVIASLISDGVWFYLGKHRGDSILRFLCRISLEPEKCAAQSRSAYSRYGPKSLLFAKFIPGFSTIAPPMAGMFKLRLWKFMVLDFGGALLWAGSFTAVGWLFRGQLEILAASLNRLGARLGMVFAFGLALYIGSKYIYRNRIYRSLRIALITPNELKERIDAGENLTIVDLRDMIERQEGRIPGSLQFTDDNLDSELASIAETEVILYCSCPNEFRRAQAALRLKWHGISRVHRLEGGFALWRDLGFPVELAGPSATVSGTRALAPHPLVG